MLGMCYYFSTKEVYTLCGTCVDEFHCKAEEQTSLPL